MTHMVIRCETSKKDKNALTLSTMLRSPFLFICCVFFLAVLPVMQLVASAARGAISPVLLLYVIALAAMLFVIIKQDGADFAGVTEYTFSDNNFTVKNEQGTCTTEYSAIYAVRENKKYFYLMPSKYAAYILPKEYLTADEGSRLRDIFSSKLKGRKSDDCFQGKSADDIISFGEAESEVSFNISDKFPSEAARATLLNIPTAVKIFYTFMLTVLILWRLSIVFAIAVSLLCLGIALISNLRKTAADIKSRITDSTATYRFFDSGYECIIGENASEVLYSDIKDIKKQGSAAIITRKSGRKIILPATDEIYSRIKKTEG